MGFDKQRKWKLVSNDDDAISGTETCGTLRAEWERNLRSDKHVLEKANKIEIEMSRKSETGTSFCQACAQIYGVVSVK